ncbi:MAG: carbohydrate-binding family 9-like protein, partial [Clostridiales bacterium]|nr:carbohydrate-binding family 9-like protein [Clostridiales bacterium]
AVPFDFFWEVYNKKKIITELRGNFYKCGDKTKHPHFGMWNPINNEFPDFHLPQFFGRIIL